MSRSPSVGLACTDQGQHGWAQLGDVGLSGGLLLVNMFSVAGEHATARRPECVWLDELGRLHAQCPRCRRHVQLRSERAEQLVKRLAEVKVGVLDISRLP